MFDNKDKTILSVGLFNISYKKHTVILAEGERIVGVASYYGKNSINYDF
jgi:hypothetical protein